MTDPDHPPHDTHVRVRWETYMALQRIVGDSAAPTADRAIREGLKARYPQFATDL